MALKWKLRFHVVGLRARMGKGARKASGCGLHSHYFKGRGVIGETTKSAKELRFKFLQVEPRGRRE